MKKEKIFLEKKLTSKILIIIGVIIIAVAAALGWFIYNNYKKIINNVVQFNQTEDINKYVYIDATDIGSDYFAKYETDDNTKYYYFVNDDDYMYIVSASDKVKRKIPGKIYGYTETMPKDLVDIAIDELNELYKDEFEVNEELFYNIFTYHYLNTYDSPKSDLIAYFILDGILAAVGLGCIIVNICNLNRNKKQMSHLDMRRIYEDIEKPSTIVNHKAKIYFTDKYLLSYSILNQIMYEDIIWIYPHSQRYNHAETKSISVMNKSGKVYNVASIGINKKNKIIFEDLYSNLEVRIPNVLSGYTAENKEKAHKMIKK